jgi:RNA polymerase sigma factor (sigma-70 family)
MDSALRAALSSCQSRNAGVAPTLELDAVGGFLKSFAAEKLLQSLRLKLRPEDTRLETYALRLWNTILLQSQRKSVVFMVTADLTRFVADLEQGRLYYGQVEADVLHDVLVAQGLEGGENEAAREFEGSYMPHARAYAQQFAGQQGVDAVDNLAADLVLPRRERPPKIATYRGLTPLKSWLRSVVANRCVSLHRNRRDVPMNETHEIMGTDTVTSAVAAVECEEKLAPAFAKAVAELPLEDRVLLKMLILDGVPQKELAVAYGVDSGTLTRRRQRAGSTLLAKIRQIGVDNGAPTAVRECLELLLAGESRQLKLRLASVLAVGIGESLEQKKDFS